MDSDDLVVHGSKMASPVKARQMKLQLKHGFVKHDLHLTTSMGEVLTIKHLQQQIYDVTGVPIDKQKILYKGKTLKDPAVYLTDAGLSDGVKIMLLGKKPDPVEDKEMVKLNSVEQSVEKQAERLNEIIYELDGIHRGFMQEDIKVPALKQLAKKLGGTTENLMKLLETLDSLRFEDHNYAGRTKRKSLVVKIQKFLDQCDGLTKGVSDMQASDSSGS